MSKILFICHGNVARSQMAEGFYNHFTNTNNAVSGGTNPYSPYMYSGPDEFIKNVMNEKGISLEGKKVKYATSNMLRKAEEVYVLCKRSELSDEVLDAEKWQNKKLNFWDVEDPYHKPLEKVREIRDKIESKVFSILHPFD